MKFHFFLAIFIAFEHFLLPQHLGFQDDTLQVFPSTSLATHSYSLKKPLSLPVLSTFFLGPLLFLPPPGNLN